MSAPAPAAPPPQQQPAAPPAAAAPRARTSSATRGSARKPSARHLKAAAQPNGVLNGGRGGRNGFRHSPLRNEVKLGAARDDGAPQLRGLHAAAPSRPPPRPRLKLGPGQAWRDLTAAAAGGAKGGGNPAYKDRMHELWLTVGFGPVGVGGGWKRWLMLGF
jgi:hypothetical protein